MTHPALSELIDYWLSELEPEHEGALEEHLFECAACEARLDAVRASAEAIVALVRSGGLSGSATTALLNRFARDRLNVRQYTLEPGEVVACTVSPHDDFLIARFVVHGGAHARIDISVRGEEEHELLRVDDVAFDPRAGHVVTFLPARPVQNQPSGLRRYVLLAPSPGGEREIGRYTLDHTAMREA